MIDRLALFLLLAGCVLFGAIVFAEIHPRPGAEAAANPVRVRPDVPPAIRGRSDVRYDELVATALSRPLFSSTRRPPQSGGGPAASELTDTRLTGIVTEPGRRIAIFAPAGAKPLTVGEGETVSGWRVDSITPREVSLSGPGGTRTVQPKFDPNLAPPASPLPTTAAAAAPPNRPAAAASRFAVRQQPGMPPVFNNAPPRPGQLRGRR